MAATFEWYESNGAGETQTNLNAGGVTTPGVMWKNADSVTGDNTNGGGTDYQSNPITATQNSYEKYLFAKISGTWTTITNGLFAHTSGAMPTGCTLYGPPTMTTDANRLSYSTPATTTTKLSTTNNMTTAISIGSGVAVWFGATGPANSGKAATFASATANPCYSNYLTTQVRTDGTAVAGEPAASIVMSLRYDEN
jgi:hypothetical protein